MGLNPDIPPPYSSKLWILASETLIEVSESVVRKMYFLLTPFILVFPTLALSLSSQIDPPCNVEECADVIDSSGCWNFARSKSALLGCVPKGSTVGVS